MQNKIKYFSGFMSASVGFEFAGQLGFECVLGNEFNKIRAKWSQEKFPNAEIVQGSFTDPKVFSYLVRKFKEEGCRLATFSPCCQPFSKAGKQHLHSNEAFLFLYIIKFIKLTMAENAWIENALEFRNAVLNDDQRTVEQRIRDELEPLGYHIEVKIQDAAGFKTPQHRRRTIFLISRIGIWKHPVECKEKDYVTVRQTIDYLPSVKAGERSGVPFHNGLICQNARFHVFITIQNQAIKFRLYQLKALLVKGENLNMWRAVLIQINRLIQSSKKVLTLQVSELATIVISVV